ncbi:MAG: succinate dehydrogenase, hydrophobic membrane anchor protein [Steroidobacteraceae bacterium]
MSLRSPLGAVLGLGAAGHGVTHWWQQRLTATALLVLGPWLLISLARLDGLDRAHLIEWLRAGLTAPVLILLVIAVAWHSKLGVQVIIEDYVHGRSKLALLVVTSFLHILLAVSAIHAILRISLAGAP